MEKLIIVWLGWAGYTAGLYAWRYGLNPLIIWEMDGWTITECHAVENFSGYPGSPAGYDIMMNMRKQAESFGSRIVSDRVVDIKLIKEWDPQWWYEVITSYSWTFQTKTLILAVWTHKNKLNIPWEKEYFGKWVSYCATCDWFFMRWKKAAVVGWWNTAFIEAIYLSDICEKVYLIHRRKEFRWEKVWYDRIISKPNVELILPSIPLEIWGENKVQYIDISKWTDAWEYKDCKVTTKERVQVDWVFFAVWTIPNSVPWIDEILHKNSNWYINVDAHMKTNLHWVYAAWDCTTWSGWFRQLITACAEWAIAAESVFQFISKTASC